MSHCDRSPAFQGNQPGREAPWQSRRGIHNASASLIDAVPLSSYFVYTPRKRLSFYRLSRRQPRPSRELGECSSCTDGSKFNFYSASQNNLFCCSSHCHCENSHRMQEVTCYPDIWRGIKVVLRERRTHELREGNNKLLSIAHWSTNNRAGFAYRRKVSSGENGLIISLHLVKHHLETIHFSCYFRVYTGHSAFVVGPALGVKWKKI